MKRWAALTVALCVVCLVVPSAALAAGAPSGETTAVSPDSVQYQQNASNVTETTDWEPPGPFTLQDLRTGGDQIAGAGGQGPPISTRMIGSGGIVLKKLPVSPIQNSYQPVEPNQRLETDYLLAYTSAFADAVGEYELTIVYWEPASKRVNGTTVNYAANQSVQRISFGVAEGYATKQLKLDSHYDQEVEGTAWLERNGERIEGARWRFSHQTNPLTASPSYPINGKGDLWGWASINLLLPIVGGIAISGVTATHILSRTIRGTGKGAAYWAIAGLFIAGVAAVIATWQTAIILANAPFAVGLLVGLLSLPVMLSIRDDDDMKAGFFRRDLDQDAISPTGEETVGTRRVANKIKGVIRHNEKLYAPKDGLRPMLARYWAKPASIPVEDWKSYDTGEGDLDQLFEIDPQSDKVLTHRAARLVFAPSLTKDVDEDDLEDAPEGDGIASLPKALAVEISNRLKSVNWRFVGISLGGGAAIYLGVNALLGAPLIALAAATVPMLIEGHEARDGEFDVEWGPSQWNNVQAQVQQERAEYRERRTYDDLLEIVADLEWGENEHAQSLVDNVRTKIQEARNDGHGVLTGADSSSDSSESSSEPASTTESQPQGVPSDD